MRHACLLAAIACLAGCQTRQSSFDEYCAPLSTHTIGMAKVRSTPAEFLTAHPDLEAAINGIYFNAKNEPEGVAYLADGHHFGTERPHATDPKHVKGYFSIDKQRAIRVGERLTQPITAHWLILGTHPLLVADGRVHDQPSDYSMRDAFRSAIGEHDGQACFAVSREKVSLPHWARQLHGAGYRGAINLDGGEISSMAVRTRDRIQTMGGGDEPTYLIIFSRKK